MTRSANSKREEGQPSWQAYTKSPRGEAQEFDRLLASAGFTADLIRLIIRKPELVKTMFAAVGDNGLIHRIFTPLNVQIERVKQWNATLGWSFTDEDFTRIEQRIPQWPESRFVAVTLVPYLGTVQDTFDALWDLAAKSQDKSCRWRFFKRDSKHLRLLDGIKHERGLRWETIDLGANRGKSPKSVRDPNDSPHAGILASAALHPDWVRAMDGNDVPEVWLPGYEVETGGGNPWACVPNLWFLRDSFECCLLLYGASCCENEFPRSAVPVFRE